MGISGRRVSPRSGSLHVLLFETGEGVGDDMDPATVEILVVVVLHVLSFNIDLHIDIRSPVAKVLARRPGVKDDIVGLGVSIGLRRDLDRFASRLQHANPGELLGRFVNHEDSNLLLGGLAPSGEAGDRVDGEIILAVRQSRSTVQGMK